MIKKLAIVGCGGIGSYFVRNLSECIRKSIINDKQIDITNIVLYDFDIVKDKNLLYQNFDIEDLNKLKAEVLSKKTGFKYINKKVDNINDILNHDFVVLCVDNNLVRLLVYNSGIHFLDLRAKGNTIIAWLTKKEDPEYMKFTQNIFKFDSCQYDNDLENENIQVGNRIVSEIGIAILLNFIRNNKNKQKIIASY